MFRNKMPSFFSCISFRFCQCGCRIMKVAHWVSAESFLWKPADTWGESHEPCFMKSALFPVRLRYMQRKGHWTWNLNSLKCWKKKLFVRTLQRFTSRAWRQYFLVVFYTKIFKRNEKKTKLDLKYSCCCLCFKRQLSCLCHIYALFISRGKSCPIWRAV